MAGKWADPEQTFTRNGFRFMRTWGITRQNYHSLILTLTFRHPGAIKRLPNRNPVKFSTVPENSVEHVLTQKWLHYSEGHALGRSKAIRLSTLLRL